VPRGVALAALIATACGAQPGKIATHRPTIETSGKALFDQRLPINQRFRNLDEYLAWLQKTEAPVDGAWYKQIRPDVYELQTGNLRVLGTGREASKRTFTREELAKKFGFAR